jgi:hydroxyacid-oxoacid transhydrogenase
MAGNGLGLAAVTRVLRTVAESSCSCPAHSQSFGRYTFSSGVSPCHPPSSSHEKEYAFEMAMSNLRYGNGVTREVGWDVLNLGIRNLVVFTDKNLALLPPVKAAVESLQKAKVTFTIFDNVSIEPTDERSA